MLLAAGALQFAFEKATLEGKITIGCLLVLSLFSLWRASHPAADAPADGAVVVEAVDAE